MGIGMEITEIHLREILDSRGNPTVEAEVYSKEKAGIVAAPSGASVGAYEVPAFPKGGTKDSINLFNSKFKSKLEGLEANYHTIDGALKKLDPGFKKLGGNTAIAISLATAKLQALEHGGLYKLLGSKVTLPYPIGNVLGGGMHAGKGSPEIQEFLSIAIGAKTCKSAILANSLVHRTALKEIYKIDPSFTRGRNDEGGWAPPVSNEVALDILKQACDKVSDEIGFSIRPGLDVAATSFWNKRAYKYRNKEKNPEEQINYVAELADKYNLYYVEDPLEENDFNGFAELTSQIGSKCLVVGDDLITTNPERLKTAIEKNSVNSLIIKPNQIGTLSDTEKVINMAKEKAYTPVVSHRSGETADNSIAHLAVGFSLPIIKTGITGGERLAKLNELIRIEENENSRMAELKLI